MADYAIGDIQGCMEPLLRLLEVIRYDDNEDRLWLVGDLVNRGPQSLEVLRFLYSLRSTPIITLGNHDLHFLCTLFGKKALRNKDDTLYPLLRAKDKNILGHWLRQQPLLYHDPTLNVVMTHAGIPPMWSLEEAKQYATELEHTLRGPKSAFFFHKMYGNTLFSPELQGIERLRAIANGFTRMRYCDRRGYLDFSYKGTICQAPSPLIPWFSLPTRVPIAVDIVFGHWAALGGGTVKEGIYAIDTGCYWGNTLTALRLQDKRVFQVPGLQK
jgi:bis(5'-nucleosyl)-tetraphosphatase (symmetrical)